MNGNNNGGIGMVIFAVVIIVFLVAAMGSCSSGGHAPGYGNTSKCTICGKPATHSSTNYGYCDEHWKKATGQN